jgi:hypothetical protein
LTFLTAISLTLGHTASTFTKGRRTTARITRKPGVLPQSGLSSSGPPRLKLVAADLRLCHHRYHHCCCSGGATGGGGGSLVGAAGLVLLLLGRLWAGPLGVLGPWRGQPRWRPWYACQPSSPPGHAAPGSGAARCSPFPGLSSRPCRVHSVLHSSGDAGGRRRSEPAGAPR